LDSHDIGPSDSGVFHFQDGEEQGEKRAIGPEQGRALTRKNNSFWFYRFATASRRDGGQQSAKTGKKITPLTQRAKSSNVSRFLTGESQTMDT